MKFVTLFSENRDFHVGVVQAIAGQNQVIDLVEANKSNPTGIQNADQALTNMVQFIEAQDKTLPWANQILKLAQENKLPANCITAESKTLLASPVPRPTSCRDGYAFRQHVESARKGRGLPMIPEFDHFPVFYFTNHLAVSGPGEIFVMPKALERLDFELEVAIVVGKEGRNIPANKADEYIFGYTIMNDWSARELQTQEMKMNLGPAKGKDFATTLGPYLVTRDELASKRIATEHGEKFDLTMKAFHNGAQVSFGNLKDMNWTFGQILERVSYGVTIYPGEVIGSGTVGTGCYMELNGSKITDNVWIKANDTFTLEVDMLGRLDNTVRAAVL